MKHHNRSVLASLIVWTFIIVTAANAETGDSSQTKAGAGKTEAPKSQTVRQFPRIAFGKIAQPFGKLAFVQGTALLTAPSEVRVYKVQPLASKKDALLRVFETLPLVASQDIDARVHQLGRIPKSSADKEDAISASIGGWRVKVWSGGQFTIDNNDLWNRPSNSTKAPTIPTAEEARKAADDFLAKIGPLPLDVHFANVVPGEWDVYGAGDKPEDTVVRSLLVSYSAAMDGIPVYGSVSVYVSEGLEVVSVVNYLRQVVPEAKVPILSSQEAFGKLCAGEGHMDDGPPWDATGNVTSLKLVYFQGALSRKHSYIMPVYVFEGNAVADGKKAKPWKAFVEAVRPEFLEAEPGRR